MNFLDVPTLLAVTAGFNAFAALIWLLLAEVFRLAPLACRMMAASHILRIVAPAIANLALTAAFREAVFNLVALTGVVLLSMALRLMGRDREGLCLPLGVGVASAVGVLGACALGALDAALGIAYAGASVLSLIAAVDMRRYFAALHVRWVGWIMSLPFVGVGLLGLFRALARMADPKIEAMLMVERAPTALLALLWWVLTSGVTVAMLSLLIWRVVARIQHLLRRDGLTGVLNRRAFQEQLVQAQALLQRGRSFCLVMADIDHFKRINDGFGHAAGDAALRHCVAVWRGCLREVDQMGRLGGEEFAVVLPGASVTEATAVAERMRHLLEASPLHWQGKDLNLSASFGVASPQPFDFEGQGGLARADAQLYRAKAEGRNRVCTAPEWTS